MSVHWDTVWFNAQLATMVENDVAYGLIENAAIAVSNQNIIWLGPECEMPRELFEACPYKVDCEGLLITPGLIDCHTHMIYAGSRVEEFENRLKGASYEDIARKGGGIISTVLATREAEPDQLFRLAKQRLQTFIDDGVTTVEIKSGYGLNLKDELKMLRVARLLGEKLHLDVVTTFLAAHTLPPEYAGRSDAYIDFICDILLPAAAQQSLVDAVDGFCEGIAFSSAQIKRVFDAARELNLSVKLHAEQLSDSKGALMASRHGAISVDHLEYLDEGDIPVLAKNNTVAVLLPGAFYYLCETRLPPGAALSRHKVPMAIASDHNPGSSPVGSLLLMLNMACTLFRMTPEEALAGVTRCAAQALGLVDNIGTLEVGKTADMVLWNTRIPAELSYQIGGNLCQRVMYHGQPR
jgi:imidazolonepropionase